MKTDKNPFRELSPDPGGDSGPRITTTVVCNSGILGAGGGIPGMPLTKAQLLKLHSPTLYLLGGEKDIAYKNGMDDVRRIEHVPVFAANMVPYRLYGLHLVCRYTVKKS